LQDYEALYQQALDDPEEFWAGMAKELDWFKPWEKVLEWNPPYAKWFVGGRTNIAHNTPGERRPTGTEPGMDVEPVLWAVRSTGSLQTRA
jgi:Acetyl-coenzyme A synthetase N-terminus